MAPLRVAVLALAAAMALAGCGSSPGGAGEWDIRVGGMARVVAEEGESAAVASSLVAPATRGRRSRKANATKFESMTLEAGARVSVLAVDGDDARIRVEDGPNAGSIGWVEARRLAAE